MTQLVHIEAIPALKDNYIWALINPQNQSALIVDPGAAGPVRDYLKQKQSTLSGILITHHHWDHTNGITDLKKWYEVPVYGPETIAGVTMPVTESLKPVHFPLNFTVLAIPGHTLDHIAYYSQGMLFCGDTLFAAGCGRLFEGTAEQMFSSLQKLADLPLATKVYCAHEYTLNNLRFAESIEPRNIRVRDKISRIMLLRKEGAISLPSTIQDEKNTNPFLRCDVPEVIEAATQFAGETLSTPLAVFTVLRQMKDSW